LYENCDLLWTEETEYSEGDGMVQDYDSPWKEGLAKYLPRFFEFFFPAIFEDV
tara:strand:- start:310 stop:468 length:159 start_codon:yes stop_codon:yes gene_type:complete